MSDESIRDAVMPKYKNDKEDRRYTMIVRREGVYSRDERFNNEQF